MENFITGVLLALLFSNYLKAFNSSTLDSKIIGGVPANPNSLRFVVSIRQRDYEHYCGGNLITRLHIISTAFCFKDEMDVEYPTIYGMYVVVGSYTRTPHTTGPGIPHSIKKIHIHPEYKSRRPRIYGNLAVVELVTRVTLGTHVRLVDLPKSDVEIGKEGIIAGWGSEIPFKEDEIEPPYSEVLKELKMETKNKTICSNIFCRETTFDPEQHFCATPINDYGNISPGDSGGPLTYEDTLVGIIVGGDPWAKYQASIYGNIFFFLSYITGIIGNEPTYREIYQQEISTA